MTRHEATQDAHKYADITGQAVYVLQHGTKYQASARLHKGWKRVARVVPGGVLTSEKKLTLSDAKEAEIATEFGDGTQFKIGDVVWHNYKRGTYRRCMV